MNDPTDEKPPVAQEVPATPKHSTEESSRAESQERDLAFESWRKSLNKRSAAFGNGFDINTTLKVIWKAAWSAALDASNVERDTMWEERDNLSKELFTMREKLEVTETLREHVTLELAELRESLQKSAGIKVSDRAILIGVLNDLGCAELDIASCKKVLLPIIYQLSETGDKSTSGATTPPDSSGWIERGGKK